MVNVGDFETADAELAAHPGCESCGRLGCLRMLCGCDGVVLVRSRVTDDLVCLDCFGGWEADASVASKEGA